MARNLIDAEIGVGRLGRCLPEIAKAIGQAHYEKDGYRGHTQDALSAVSVAESALALIKAGLLSDVCAEARVADNVFDMINAARSSGSAS